MRKRHFKPWRRDAAAAALCFAATATATTVGATLHQASGCFAIAIACATAGASLAVRARNRWYGQAVERRALRALTREPLEVTPNVMTCHGDVDAIVSVRRCRLRYAVEIKAWHSPRRITKIALRQTCDNARALNCVGVLWLPNAPIGCAKRGEVWIISGPAATLTSWVLRRAA